MVSRTTDLARRVALLPFGVAFHAETKRGLSIIATVEGQELHVSVAHPKRLPTWDDLKSIKAMFWHPEADVIQFLPPESEYVNEHAYCLHMYGDVAGVRRWRLASLLEINVERQR